MHMPPYGRWRRARGGDRQCANMLHRRDIQTSAAEQEGSASSGRRRPAPAAELLQMISRWQRGVMQNSEWLTKCGGFYLARYRLSYDVEWVPEE